MTHFNDIIFRKFIGITMKKMGRPSRKMVASALTFETPDGETLYFSIDKKGKSKFLGNNKIHIQKCIPHNIFTTESTANEKIIENSNKKYESQINKTSPKFTIQFHDDKFNIFLKQIENRLNVDDFYKDFRLSNHMMLPILA